MSGLGRWLSRLGRRQPKATPAATPNAAPAPVPPATPDARQVVAVTILGIGGDQLEQVIELVERQCVEHKLKPVCITDQPEFGPFRRRRMIVDHVVDAERRAFDVPGLPWRLYLRGQFALLGRRWRPATVISFGRPPESDCLEALRQHRG